MHSRKQFVDSAVIRRSSASNDENGFLVRNFQLLLGQILPVFMITFNIVHPVPAQDDPYRGQRSPESQAQIDSYLKEVRSIEFGRKQIKDVPSGSLVDLGFEEVANYQKLQIYERLAFLLQDDVHPQPKSKAPPRSWMKGEISREEVAAAEAGKRSNLRDLKPGRMTVRAFAAYSPLECDLVEYSWEHEGMHLRALMAREVFRLDLDLEEVRNAAQSTGMNTHAYLRDLMPKLVRLKGKTKTVPPIDYDVEVPLPGDLAEGVEFSSNPEKLLDGMDFYRWYERIDSFVESGHLAFLFYMKPFQRSYFQDASKWFDDDFRQLVHEKAREQRKSPSVEKKSGG